MSANGLEAEILRVVSNNFDVICKDSRGDEYELLCFSYDEFENTITIETSVYNVELQRGWIGDLSYSAKKNFDIETADEYNFEIIDTYKDVLLTNITPSASHESATVWKYTFLKK